MSPHNNVFVNVLCLKLTTSQAPVWLLGLQPIKAKTEGLDNLQLKDNSFKDKLQALVKMHFMQQQTQHTSNYEYDIVRGKGKYNAPVERAMYIGANSLPRERTCAPAPWGAWCW